MDAQVWGLILEAELWLCVGASRGGGFPLLLGMVCAESPGTPTCIKWKRAEPTAVFLCSDNCNGQFKCRKAVHLMQWLRFMCT